MGTVRTVNCPGIGNEPHLAMKKPPNWIYFLVGMLLVMVLLLGIFCSQRSSGNFNNRVTEIVYFLRTGRNPRAYSPCINKLQRIQMAKEMWADNEGKTTNDVPNWTDLQKYLAMEGIRGIPVCPEGGTYKINRAGDEPTCSIGGLRHSR
jgi:hypothetical protein